MSLLALVRIQYCTLLRVSPHSCGRGNAPRLERHLTVQSPAGRRLQGCFPAWPCASRNPRRCPWDHRRHPAICAGGPVGPPCQNERPLPVCFRRVWFPRTLLDVLPKLRHLQKRLAARESPAYEVAAHNGSRPSPASPAVHIDHVSLLQCTVNGVQNRSHFRRGLGDIHIPDGHALVNHR